MGHYNGLEPCVNVELKLFNINWVERLKWM